MKLKGLGKKKTESKPNGQNSVEISFYRSDSNESYELSFSYGFSGSSNDSSENDSRTGRGKPATLSRKRAWNQSSEGVNGCVKP